MHRKRWAGVAALVGLLALGLAWWIRQPPPPEVVAQRVIEAIHKGDPQTLYAFACVEERERLFEPQLQAVLDAMHRHFPMLKQVSGNPIAYRPKLKAPTTMVPVQYCYSFFYKRAQGDTQLVACSFEESELLWEKAYRGGLPEPYVELHVCVATSAQGRHRCALVVQALVICVLQLSVYQQRSEPEIRALLDEIFIRNGVRVAQFDTASGQMRRLDAIRIFRKPDGKIGYTW